MTPLAALCGALLLGGAVLVARGLVPAPVPARQSRHRRRRRRLERRTIVLLLIGLCGGLVGAALTGWLVTLFVVPVAVVGLPLLLSYPPNRDIELLEALDRWVRGLSAMLPTGQSVVDAIRQSSRSAPPMLQVERTVGRLDQRWSIREALFEMADELDSPDVDSVLAALMLAADRGGTGATAALTALSDSIQARLKAMREIEAERSKPRIVVRQITLITVVVLAGSLLLGRDFFAPYGTPLGQVVLAALLTVYVGSLVALRTMTLPRRRQRILTRGQT